MRAVLIASLLGMVSPCVSEGATQSTATASAFERELYSNITLVKVLEPRPSTASLSERQRRDLMDAKALMTAFLKCVARGPQDARRFMSAELQSRFPKRDSVEAVFVPEEGGLLRAQIFDWTIDGNGDSIVLSYDLTAEQEGTEYKEPRRMTVGRVAGAWKILELDR